MGAAPPRPDISRRLPQFQAATWVKILLAFGVSLLVVRLTPSGGGERIPPLRPLLLTAILVTAVMSVALYLSVHRDLGLPVRVAVLAACFNGLILVVKFVLAPRGLYQVNRDVDLTSFAPLNDPVGAALAAGFVFLLYLLAFWVIYRVARRRLAIVMGSPRTPKRDRGRSRYLVLGLVAGALVFSGGAGIVLVIPLVVASGGLEYLRFVFASSMSALIALALAGATALAAAAFNDTAERSRVLGDASVLVSFFWLGVYLLALYHVLWVVYILVLTSIWPLKVVVPK
jgi:hypothetical protein